MHFSQFPVRLVSSLLICFPVLLLDFLGRTEVRIKDILKETHQTRGPIIKRMSLLEVDSGEVIVKLDLQLYENT